MTTEIELQSIPTELTDDEIFLILELKQTIPKEDGIKRVLKCTRQEPRYKLVKEQFDDLWLEPPGMLSDPKPIDELLCVGSV